MGGITSKSPNSIGAPIDPIGLADTFTLSITPLDVATLSKHIFAYPVTFCPSEVFTFLLKFIEYTIDSKESTTNLVDAAFIVWKNNVSTTIVVEFKTSNIFPEYSATLPIFDCKFGGTLSSTIGVATIVPPTISDVNSSKVLTIVGFPSVDDIEVKAVADDCSSTLDIELLPILENIDGLFNILSEVVLDSITGK